MAARSRQFIPQDLDFSNAEELTSLYRQLLEREIDSVASLQQWLLEVSELYTAIDEHFNRLYIQKSCHTEEKDIEAAYLHFIENVEPELKPLFFEVQKKCVESPFSKDLPAAEYEVLLRNWQTDVELFRPENVPLQTELTKLSTQYDKICGAMTVEFQGQTYTLPQMSRFLEETDRATRQAAWQAIWERRGQDRERIDEIFQELLTKRHQLAQQTGLNDFRDYIWKDYKRFDYTPEDCAKFADAVEACCLPVVKQLYAKRAEQLGVESLRPWDLGADPQGRRPLRPFDEKNVEQMVTQVHRMFTRISPELADEFSRLKPGRNLDLESRHGKQPGGYQTGLEESHEPFIFMNAAGMQDDVCTLLHEAGHAFHFFAATHQPLVFTRHAPIEFCEVASMTMELLALPHYDLIYTSSEDANRARLQQLERVVTILLWVVTIDSYQHWLYTHPGHSLAERTAAWLQVHQRFSGPVDWSGLEDIREFYWQRQLHLFDVPFYYVEYGIAQLGAMQIWLRAQEDSRQALADYRHSLALGGRRPLPELFETAGTRFDFSEQTLRPLMEAASTEIAKL